MKHLIEYRKYHADVEIIFKWMKAHGLQQDGFPLRWKGINKKGIIKEDGENWVGIISPTDDEEYAPIRLGIHNR